MAYLNKRRTSVIPSSTKNWGSDTIPKEEWIDPGKKYTSEGCDVIGLRIDIGDNPKREPTYPVSGIVVGRMKGMNNMKKGRWTLDGRRDICFEQDRRNLVEVK